MSQESVERQYSPEVIDITTARFMDVLPTQYEEQWSTLMLALSEAKLPIDEPLARIWHDEDTPQVFRDRAMLVLVGDVRRDLLSADKPYARSGYLLWCDNKVNYIDRQLDTIGATKEQFDIWLQQAIAYGDSHDPVIGQKLRFIYTVNRFNAGIIDEDSFKKRLHGVNIRTAQPSSYDFFNDDSLSMSRFPLLHDILLSGKFENLHSWAMQQFIQTCEHWQNEDVALPEWLAQTTKPQATELAYAMLSQRFVSEERNAVLSDMWPHIKNLDVLSQLPPHVQYDVLVKSDNIDIQTAALRAILGRKIKDSGLLFHTLGLADIAYEAALRIGDDDLIQTASYHRQKTIEHRKISEIKEKAASDIYAAKMLLEQQQKQAAQDKLKGILQVLRRAEP